MVESRTLKQFSSKNSKQIYFLGFFLLLFIKRELMSIYYLIIQDKVFLTHLKKSQF